MVGDEEVLSLSNAKVYVFSDSVSCFGKMHHNPHSNTVWEDELTWYKSSSQYRTLDTIDGEPMEYFPKIHHIAALQQSPRVHVKNIDKPEELKGRVILCRCSTTSHGHLKTTNRNANLTPTSFPFMREDFHQEAGHSSDQDQKRSGILLMVADHKENAAESLN